MRRTLVALAFALLGATAVSFAQFDTFLEVTRLLLGDGVCEFSTGSGSPEGVVTGDVCDVFTRTDGSTANTFYVKEAGSGNTGWLAVGAGAVAGSGTANQMTRWATSSSIEDASMTDAEVVTGTTTDVFTNKSYDAEGTGNVLTVTEKWNLQMGRCDGSSPDHNFWTFQTANKPTPACQNGTNITNYLLNFLDDATDDIAQTNIHLPSDFTGTIDALIVWTTTATTGDVVWNLATICVADGEGPDPAFNTASTVTDTAQGVANTHNDAAIIGVTITGCAAGETLHVQILRNGSNASDTIAATASIIGVELTIRRAI